MLRVFIYDLLSIIIVVLFIMTCIYIIKHGKGKSIGHIVIWCIINACFPIIGFCMYCVFTRIAENRIKN